MRNLSHTEIYQHWKEELKETWKERKNTLIGLTTGILAPLVVNFAVPKAIEHFGGAPELANQIREYGLKFSPISPLLGTLIGYLIDD